MSSAWGQLPPLSAHDFDAVRRLAFETCGISLHEGKSSLVSSRLERLVHKYCFDSFSEYIRHLVAHRSSDAFGEFIDHLTTNHSSFWREPEHFQFLSEEILAGRQTSIRIWSAACATGEEPYTLAMCCAEKSVPAAILASDVSRTALAAAARGEYEESRLAALPGSWRDRYFDPDCPGPGYRSARRELRTAIKFGALNLLQSLNPVGQFDVIFCRNVMIYFEQATRDDLVRRLLHQLVPGGILFTGHSETLLRLPAGLSYIQPATYRRS